MRVDTDFPDLRRQFADENADALASLFRRIQQDAAARFQDGAPTLVPKDWDVRLADLILDRNVLLGASVAERVAAAFGMDFDPAILEGWLQVNAEEIAKFWNGSLEEDVRQSAEDDPVSHVFEIAATSGAVRLAHGMVTTTTSFVARDVGEKSGATVKVWRVNSGNPRKRHQRMSGQAVAIGSLFSNGMSGPGDPRGGAPNNSNCRCSLTIVK